MQQQKKLKSKVQQIFIGLKTDVRLEVATGSCVVLLLMHGSQTTFFKMGHPGLFLFIFVLFSLQSQYKMEKSVDGVLGIRTRGRRMVGADETTELCCHPDAAMLLMEAI